MNEYVLAIISCDEAVSLLCIEPLYLACSHYSKKSPFQLYSASKQKFHASIELRFLHEILVELEYSY